MQTLVPVFRYAFLIIRISTRDDGDTRLGCAWIVGEVRHVGRDIHEFSGFRRQVLLELFAEAGRAFSGDHVDGGFMMLVQVSIRLAAGWNCHQFHAKVLGADGLGRDAIGVIEPGVALLSSLRRNNFTVWHSLDYPSVSALVL